LLLTVYDAGHQRTVFDAGYQRIVDGGGASQRIAFFFSAFFCKPPNACVAQQRSCCILEYSFLADIQH
jgi:hypothetical protein